MKPIRVYIVDDNEQFLKLIANLLSNTGNILVVGKSSSGLDAIAHVFDALPDLILMDISMPDMNGIETTRLIKAIDKSKSIVMLTMHDTPEYRDASAQAGAIGYVSKADCVTNLVQIIERYAQSREQ
jgi:DNA-binding NarL/FixJ family response regulator